MNPSDMIFHRQWSMSTYKDQTLMLGKMTFTKNFLTNPAGRGDTYPLLSHDKETEESISNNCYTVKGRVERMFCRFFPYATYRLRAHRVSGEIGFAFHLPEIAATVTADSENVMLRCGDQTESIPLPETASDETTIIVSCRPGNFDVYFETNGVTRFHHTFRAEAFGRSHDYARFSRGYATLTVDGEATIYTAEAYIDNGISLADMRSIRYENGDVMVEDGKVYLTASIRMQEETFQGVFSWLPGTAELRLVGALFYDVGDGLWCGDVAASILYHRTERKWYLWVCSFSHGHILAHSAFDGDPRFGVNVIDVTLVKEHEGTYDLTSFDGYDGDEDPDFFYDEQTKQWYLAVCRVDRTPGRQPSYRYVFFKSDRPFDGYTYIGQGRDGAETGGSFVRIDDVQYFICGNGAISDYRIYSKAGMQSAEFDFPDGAWRGWGTLLPIKRGSRTRCFWITFDRHNGSDYTWSYGDVYGFEGVPKYPLRLNDIHIRDPFILPYNGKYYMYGTNDKRQGLCGFDVYVGNDLEHWSLPKRVFEQNNDFWGTTDFWAPEVHLYKGKFYMFASFKAPERHRATHILVSDTPDGTFVPVSASPATPADWDCLDGTLYIDKAGKPHIVFGHEWAQINRGTICSVPLSDDLSAPLAEPRVLWYASDYAHVRGLNADGSGFVTDGPYLYRCENGDLLAIWSTFDENGYVEVVAKSDNGDIDGNWTISDTPLSAENGGHGMIFRDLKGQLYFVMHRPNTSPLERAVLLPLSDQDGVLSFQ